MGELVGNTYLIQGTGVEIDNPNQTYLDFIIVKQPVSSSGVQIGPWETIINQWFIPV